MKNNLDIYFSDACNLNCSYCCANHSFDNQDIINSLNDGSFVQHIKNVLDETIVSITLWGLEPTINGQYFQKFIYELLEYSPYIKFINFSTNGQNNNIWNDFIYPLLLYANTNKRKLKLWIQFNLDGPRFIHEAHRGIGTYDKLLNTLKSLFRFSIEPKSYLILGIGFKSTFEPNDWYTDPHEWYGWKFNLYNYLLQQNNQDLIYWEDNFKYFQPTFKQPYLYTKEDGIAFARWNLFLRGDQIKICNSKSIDYQGNLYDCHLLKNKDENNQITREFFDNTLDELIQQNEVEETVNRDRLFNLVSSIYCWSVNDLSYLKGYLRLLGNGANIKGGKYNMTTVVFNNDLDRSFEIVSFSRNTSFGDGNMNSYAYMGVVPSENAVNNISYYGLNTITSMKLYDEDEQVIYNITNLNGSVNSIDEALDGDKVVININVRLNAEME